MEKLKRKTPQKELIRRIVCEACDHPGAETVYERARAEIPSISLGTVYRTLKELAQQNLLREITVPSAPSRFDKTTAIHAHFLCEVCGAVTDIEVDEKKIMAEARENNPETINEADIVFRGICQNCKEEKI